MEFFILMLKAIGSVFLNPVLYWIMILSFLPSDDRIKLEESSFGYRVFPIAAELKNTLPMSLFVTALLLFFNLIFKVTLPFEALIILSLVMILLSIRMDFLLLSASYTLGFTYLILWFLPKGPKELIHYTDWTFISISIMIGIFLLGEAILIFAFKNRDAMPKLALSKRNRWYGKLQMKKLCIIPFVVLFPSETGSLLSTLSLKLLIDGKTFSVLIMPFILGFNHSFRGDLPERYNKSIAFSIFLLSLIVLSLSFLGLLLSKLSLLAALIAIVGRISIHYYFYRLDAKNNYYFLEGQEEQRVLGVISGSPSEKLGFQIGDVIVAINNQRISSLQELEERLQKGKEGYYLIEINRTRSRVRYIEVKNFHGNTIDLGLIFTKRPLQI